MSASVALTRNVLADPGTKPKKAVARHKPVKKSAVREKLSVAEKKL
jgi:hypothetical protein